MKGSSRCSQVRVEAFRLPLLEASVFAHDRGVLPCCPSCMECLSFSAWNTLADPEHCYLRPFLFVLFFSFFNEFHVPIYSVNHSV